MSKPREWWIVEANWHDYYDSGMRVFTAPEDGTIHVIEAAPVLKEIAELKKENAQLKADLAAIYKAESGG